MRTTLVLDDTIVKMAKHRAVSLNIPLSELINRILRDALQEAPSEQDERFVMSTHGQPGGEAYHEPGDLYRIQEAEEAESVRSR